MDKLIELIKQNKDCFFNSVSNRMYTSVANKDKHAMVLAALSMCNYRLLEELFLDRWYHKPLEGVIYCMECDFELKMKFIEAFGDVKDTNHEM